jgi:hypothetical protein
MLLSACRFLLEMDVQLHKPKEETVHTSEYVYLKKGSSQLCHTTNFQWRKGVEVHFIVSGEYMRKEGREEGRKEGGERREGEEGNGGGRRGRREGRKRGRRSL